MKPIERLMNSARLFFAGDFCSTPSTSLIEVSEELQGLINSCDVKVVNFEVPLKTEAKLPTQYNARLWQHDDAPEFLRNLGFNLFSLANNHAFDWDEDGLKKTLHALGEQSVGAGTYDEAYRVKVVEVKGIRIGFMALSFAAYAGVFDNVRHHDGVGCAYIHDLRVNHDILEAKKTVDYLFILPHDGIEYLDVPLPETIARYHDFIDYGADGVIGSHPHCPQGWETYKGKPIFYSLGNFFFNSKETPNYTADKPHWYEGLCVVIEVNNQIDKQIQVNLVYTKNVRNTLLTIDESSNRQEHQAVLQDYLANESLYDEYLNNQLQKIVFQSDIPVVTDFRQKTGFVSTMKRVLKSVLCKNRAENSKKLSQLLKNDTRRESLIRYLEEK